MKVRIKTFNGDLPEYLTEGMVYPLDTTQDLESGDIYCDDGERIFIQINECAFLNGGSWEIVND